MRVVLLIILFFLLACGKKGSSDKKRYTRITEEEIAEVLENQKFECASLSAGLCPRGVTRLITVNRQEPDRSSVCSGFMMSSNRLVTNHHCISNEAECANTYFAIYTGGRPQISRCARILASEEDYADPNDDRRAIDYSVVETTGNFEGDFFPLASTRAMERELVHAWVVDHTGLDDPFEPNLFESRITEFHCRVQNQNEKASLMLEDCPVISGNSGSPILNQKREVLGVVWGATATGLNSNTPLEFRRSLEEFAAVTEMIYFQRSIESID